MHTCSCPNKATRAAATAANATSPADVEPAHPYKPAIHKYANPPMSKSAAAIGRITSHHQIFRSMPSTSAIAASTKNPNPSGRAVGKNATTNAIANHRRCTYAQNASASSTANGSSVNSENECKNTSGCANVKINASPGHRYPSLLAIRYAASAITSAQTKLVIRTPMRPLSTAGIA